METTAVSLEAEALAAQCDEVCGLLADLGEEEWERPTRCPPLHVRQLVGHLGRVFHRFAEALAEDVEAPVNCDRYRYWDPSPGREERVVREALEFGSERPPSELLEWFVEGARAAVGAAKSAAPDRRARKGDLVLNAVDFTATRVLEAGVHGMDLGHATLRGESIHPRARQVVVDILLGRLPRPLPVSIGWDERTLILTGTGRRPLSAVERHTLGDVAASFPLVS